jgi:RimJ/RimL family protein N-acetyltransferase
MKVNRVKSLSNIENLRNAYLDGLLEPQELFLELKVQQGQYFELAEDNSARGYVIIDADRTLLEFFVDPSLSLSVDMLFPKVMQKLNMQSALCKSFDFVLLACCHDCASSVESVGYLFRHYHPPNGRFDWPWDSQRLAKENDIPRIYHTSQDFFESKSELIQLIEKEALFIFEKGDVLLGCGLFQPVIPGGKDIDIGMVVHPALRRRGVGTAIIRFLVEYVKKAGGRPIAGCDARNVGSKRCLEKAGMVSQYRLLSFMF